MAGSDSTRSDSGRLRGRAGRPRSGRQDVRRALLDAACGLFARHGFAAVSTREIAATAGVNPAMIHYYFGDKLGLYAAMLDDVTAPVFEALAELSAGPDGPALDQVITTYVGTLAANPWIAPLLVREVFSDRAPFREQFVERFASRAGSLLLKHFESASERGELRQDVDPRLAAVSLISLCIFPFVAAPVLKEVFGLEIDAESARRIASHNSALLEQGFSRTEPSQ